MKDYVIITDSGCDIPSGLLSDWGVTCIDLTFHFKGEDHEYTNRDHSTAQFYGMMREGRVMQTSAANIGIFTESFGKALADGKDILYLGFSSGLSCTVNNAQIAAEELRQSYPRNTVRVVDSLCGSAGQGLLLYLAVKKKNEGCTLDEAAGYAEDTAGHLCHWFTVDDLVYLKRGGRIDPASAFVATVLNIKPVLHIDDAGHLVSVSKVRGRKSAVRALAEKYEELACDPGNGVFFISHGDCLQDAQLLDSMLFEKYGNHAEVIADIGSVIGAHSGPGTLALFFLGKHR